MDPYEQNQIAAADEIRRQQEKIQLDERADWLDEFARTLASTILEQLALEFEQHPHYHPHYPTPRIFTGMEIARILRAAKERV